MVHEEVAALKGELQQIQLLLSATKEVIDIRREVEAIRQSKDNLLKSTQHANVPAVASQHAVAPVKEQSKAVEQPDTSAAKEAEKKAQEAAAKKQAAEKAAQETAAQKAAEEKAAQEAAAKKQAEENSAKEAAAKKQAEEKAAQEAAAKKKQADEEAAKQAAAKKKADEKASQEAAAKKKADEEAAKPAAKAEPKKAAAALPAGQQPPAEQTWGRNEVLPTCAEDYYKAVRMDSSPISWVLLKHVDNKKIRVEATGAGGVSEVVALLGEKDTGFAYVRFETGDEETRRCKFVLISWCGQRAPIMRKAKMSVHKADVKDIFHNYAVEMQANEPDDIDEKAIMASLRRAGGANYNGQTN